MSHPIRLTDLRPAEAAAALAARPSLLIPVGTLTPRGPHLPLGCDTVLLERLADDLSARSGIATAPIIPVGVHAPGEESSPGAASLSRKSLHRVMNELIESWETGAKVREIVILTAHVTEAHLEALSTIRTSGTVRLVDVLAVAAAVRSEFTDASDQLETTLLLHLAPESVALDRHPDGPGLDPDGLAALGRRIYQGVLDRLHDQIVRSTGRES